MTIQQPPKPLVPDWRAKAPPGVSLASIQPKQVAAVQQATYILPNARDRWMATNVHYYTPKRVENIARSAMSGNLVAQWQMFDLMEQTWPRLVKNLNEIKDAVVDLNWSLTPYAVENQTPSKEAIRRRCIISEVIRNMTPKVAANENGFDDTLRDIMDALGKGISVLEIAWEKKPALFNLKGTDLQQTINAWRPRATRWVHPRYYGYPAYSYVVDGNISDELMLFTPELKNSNEDLINDPEFNNIWVPFPENDFILSIIKQKTGHPLNASLLRVLGFLWSAQNFTWEWFINCAQIFGQPFRWVTYDPTQKNLLALISQMMQQMGSSAWAALPEGTKLEMMEAIQNGRDNPQKILIDMADQVADILILGQTLTTSQGERGSQALGKVHKNVRDEKIQALSNRVAETLNQQLIRATCIKNFGNDQECPGFVPASKDAKSNIEKAQTFQIVLSSGASIPKQHFYGELDIPVPEPGEDVIAPMQQQQLKPPGEPGVDDSDTATARAGGLNSLDALTNNVLENVTSVQHRWLGAVKPAFRALVAAAQNGDLSDEQFLHAIAKAQRSFPELFDKLDRSALQAAMERAMGAAAVNGAVAGIITRRAA